MTLKPALIIFLLILFSSCDPGMMLVVRASEKNNSSVTIYGNNKLLRYKQEEKESKVIIKVPEKDSVITYKKEFLYGYGGWDIVNVNYLSDNMDSIIIISSSGTLVLKDKAQMHQYLLKQTGGYGNHKLTIEAN